MFDELISIKDHSKLAPLYTKTTNWRALLKKNSEIEFTKYFTPADNCKWLPAIVTQVDDYFNTISVKYKQTDGKVFEATDIDIASEQVNYFLFALLLYYNIYEFVL
jgi:hypothetical protein